MKTTKFILNHSVLSLIVLTLSFVPFSINADSLDNWHLRNRLPQGNSLNAVTYGNGIFVAVGDNGTILTSPDGVTWTQESSGTTDRLNAVNHGNGIFVAGGDGGAILTSADGITSGQLTIRQSAS